MNNLHDTQPNQAIGNDGPPRILFWGMIVFFILIIVGVGGGLFAFNNVLSTGQQARVVEAVPFMDAFLSRQPTPEGGLLPTIDPNIANEADAMSLLDISLGGDDATDEPSAVNEAVATAEPTQAPTLMPTIEATQVPTEIPTEAPTQVPTEIPPTATKVVDNSSALPITAPVTNVEATSLVSLPTNARIYGLTHYQQTWNNCGPATITMALSYYGWQNDQAYAASFLKPNREDKNVSPNELVDFVNERTAVRAVMRMGGDLELIKQLLNSQFPVVIESGLMPEAYDWIGHYRAVVAYDDVSQQIYMFDSFLGSGDFEEGVTETYADFDEYWRHFNRMFIVVYEPAREAELQRIMGDLWDEQQAAEIAFATAQEEARANPQDGFAWFNIGTSLVALDRHAEAANAFDQARRHNLPFRMMWYQFGPFEAYYTIGRFDDVVSIVQSNLNNAEELEETYYWYGRALQAQDQNELAAVQYRTALRYNPNFTPAREALDSL